MTVRVADPKPQSAQAKLRRLRAEIRGAVQGVGFRPYVYRLARSLRLSGWVENSGQGVTIEIEGDESVLAEFVRRLPAEIPPQASIDKCLWSTAVPEKAGGFIIRPSPSEGRKSARILPDLAICPDCAQDLSDPANRRFRYPFTNCTNCGPRYSIIARLPYDRPNTSMSGFAMCADCEAEYTAPANRRFHAQPNACPVCGPHVSLWDRLGRVLADREMALQHAAEAIRAGQIVAVKGLGGFHLMVDARNSQAVGRLRARKLRAEKPFAVMYPSVAAAGADCVLTTIIRTLLESAAAPIVIIPKCRNGAFPVADSVAPGNPNLGVMRPYTPLHLLLLGDLGFPVVATSGNRSDEPIVTDEYEALARLGDIADLFLVHDRPILRPVDDSVVTVMAGRELILRLARGYAPMAVSIDGLPGPAIAYGPHMKNSIAIGDEDMAVASQHIGDLNFAESREAFVRTANALIRLHEITPRIAVHDMHPDYASTLTAQIGGLPALTVQHHHAHVLSCLVDNDTQGPVLGISWDGTGFGADGTIWGGEFLQVNGAAFTRHATLHPFRLPGGEAAIREPRRAALGVLYEALGTDGLRELNPAPLRQFSPDRHYALFRMLERGINSPLTTSVGRLFDAVASLLDIRHVATFEGQGAMDLEYAIDHLESDRAYPFRIPTNHPGGTAGARILDWRPCIRAILDDTIAGAPAGLIATSFHNTMVEMAAGIVSESNATRVALSGGCFQNRYLTERLIHRLQGMGVEVLWHRRIPPNDGGIAIGQLAALAARQQSSTHLKSEEGAGHVSGRTGTD